jgi:hypothetical protein
MATFISSLPVRDNDGNSIARNVDVTLARLRMAGVRLSTTAGCHGMWYGDDGHLYAEEVVFVVMMGDETAMRRELAAFGEATKQLAMLFVPVSTDRSHVAAVDEGREGAARLAKEYGGATLFPSGNAVSLQYAAIDAAEYRAILAH